jgi:hypothetical protein
MSLPSGSHNVQFLEFDVKEMEAGSLDQVVRDEKTEKYFIVITPYHEHTQNIPTEERKAKLRTPCLSSMQDNGDFQSGNSPQDLPRAHISTAGDPVTGQFRRVRERSNADACAKLRQLVNSNL